MVREYAGGGRLIPFGVLLAAILACAAILWGGPRLAIAALSGLGFADDSNAVNEAIALSIVFGLLLGAGLIGGKLSGARAARLGPHAGLRLAQGATLGLSGLLLAAALAAIAGVLRQSGSGGSPAGLLLSGTALILLQAGSEEVFFRGWLQPVLVKAWGGFGIMVTAAAFAALHLIGGAGAAVSVLNLFLGGLLFGLLAYRAQGLASAIGAHFTWNWAEQMALGLYPNPGVGSFGALWDFDLAGSSWWGGSAEGLNASVAMTFALASLLAPLLIVPATGRLPEPNRRGRAAA